MALLELDQVTKKFALRSSWWRKATRHVHAVTEVSLHVSAGETVAIVGESGCGKSTLARLMVQLLAPDSGDIRFGGESILCVSRTARRTLSRERQLVLQDSSTSMNPRWLLRDILEEPLVVHRLGSTTKRLQLVEAMLEQIGLPVAMLDRYPHELSGGQRQRINIARAMLLRPKLLVADEPVSALDVSVQGEILNTLRDLQRDTQVAMILITHDLRVAAQMAHRVAVMYLGRIVELLPAAQLAQAQHPYTRALLAAVPTLTAPRQAALLQGDPPSPILLPPGCAFAPRCPRASAECTSAVPTWNAQGDGVGVACCHLV